MRLLGGGGAGRGSFECWHLCVIGYESGGAKFLPQSSPLVTPFLAEGCVYTQLQLCNAHMTSFHNVLQG